MNIWNTKDKNLKELCNVENAEKQQKTKSNTGKRLFELIEFVAVVSICIFMFFYEQGVALNLQTGDSVVVRRADKTTGILKLNTESFLTVLHKKMSE